MYKKILFYPYEKLNDFLTSREDKLLQKIPEKWIKRILLIMLIVEVIICTIYAISEKSISVLFVSAYENTIVGNMVSTLFALASRAPWDEVVGFETLLFCGITDTLCINFIHFLGKMKLKGILITIYTMLFQMTISSILGSIYQGLLFVGLRVVPLGILFLIIATFLTYIALLSFISSIKEMAIVVGISLVAEYVLLFVVFIAFLPVLVLFAALLGSILARVAPEMGPVVHEKLMELQHNLLYGGITNTEKYVIATVFMSIGYFIYRTIHETREKRKKKKRGKREARQVKQR